MKYKIFKNAIISIWFLNILLPACKLIETDVSDKRNPVPQVITLSDYIEVSSTGTVRISKSDFFPSGFRIKENNRLIYIDPLAVNYIDRADFIFITHAHLDHFSVKDIKKILKPETVIICPKAVAGKLAEHNYRIRKVQPGDSFCLGNNLKVEVVEAYNLKPALLWLKAHPKSRQNSGYILNIDSVRIYHSGDSDYIPEMEKVMNVDLILVPIGGDNLTMDADDAAELINRIKPEIAVPMHYDIKERTCLERLLVLANKSTEIKVME